MDCGKNSSTTFGARTARCQLARPLMSSTGAHSTPYFHDCTSPAEL
jgi:hypothetical protein